MPDEYHKKVCEQIILPKIKALWAVLEEHGFAGILAIQAGKPEQDEESAVLVAGANLQDFRGTMAVGAMMIADCYHRAVSHKEASTKKPPEAS